MAHTQIGLGANVKAPNKEQELLKEISKKDKEISAKDKEISELKKKLAEAEKGGSENGSDGENSAGGTGKSKGK